jgi:hypothetical protein
MILLRTPLLELARISASASGFPRHTHDEYVISANLGGLEAGMAGRKIFVVSPDMLTIYPPQAVQASHSLSGSGWDCLSLYVAPAAFPHCSTAPPDLPSHLHSRNCQPAQTHRPAGSQLARGGHHAVTAGNC